MVLRPLLLGAAGLDQGRPVHRLGAEAAVVGDVARARAARRRSAGCRRTPAPSPCTRRCCAGSPGGRWPPRRAGRASAAASGPPGAGAGRPRTGRRGGSPARRDRRGPARRSRRRTARAAEAAWATWCGTKRTAAGSSPGSAVARNPGARAGVALTQPVPGVVEPQLVGRAGQLGVVGVGDGVEVGRLQPGLPEAPGGGELGQLPRGEGHRTVPVLAPAEPLLLGRRDRDAVHHQRGRGVVEQRVDTQNPHPQTSVVAYPDPRVEKRSRFSGGVNRFSPRSASPRTKLGDVSRRLVRGNVAPVRLSVVGTGYLGATHAVCLASWGHTVVGVDVDPERIARLSRGEPPFHEPGFAELLRSGLASGRLSFTTNLAEAVDSAEVHFVCVGTPQSADTNAADLSALRDVMAEIGPRLGSSSVVVGRSTVPVGTAAGLLADLRRTAPAGVAGPARVEPGVPPRGTGRRGLAAPRPARRRGRRRRRVRDPHGGLRAAGARPARTVVRTDLPTAELAKVSANVMLAARVSLVQRARRGVRAAGADIGDLIAVLRLRPADRGQVPGARHRLRRWLPAQGPARVRRAGRRARARLRHPAADRGRRDQPASARAGGRPRPGPSPTGSTTAGWPCWARPSRRAPTTSGTQPALDVALRLHALGARVHVHDPLAGDNVRRVHPELRVDDDVETACAGADLRAGAHRLGRVPRAGPGVARERGGAPAGHRRSPGPRPRQVAGGGLAAPCARVARPPDRADPALARARVVDHGLRPGRPRVPGAGRCPTAGPTGAAGPGPGTGRARFARCPRRSCGTRTWTAWSCSVPHEADLLREWTGRRPAGRAGGLPGAQHPGRRRAVHAAPARRPATTSLSSTSRTSTACSGTAAPRGPPSSSTGSSTPGTATPVSIARAAVVINDPVRRGRAVGTDLVSALAEAVPRRRLRHGRRGPGRPPGPARRPAAGVRGPAAARACTRELARRRVYVHTARWTSLGLSLLEAMHLGMPVVALAATEAVRAVPPHAGVLTTSVEELVSATVDLLRRPDEAARTGRHARDEALTPLRARPVPHRLGGRPPVGGAGPPLTTPRRAERPTAG